jgi:hypothetical protein
MKLPLVIATAVWFGFGAVISADAIGAEGRQSAETAKGILAEKGLEGLASRLGAAVLKLRDQKFSEALDPIQLTPGLRQAMEGAEDMKSLAAAASGADTIDCVGFKMISTQAVTFVYVFVTEDGPWGVKFRVHIYRGKFFVSGFAATSSWDGIETMYGTVEPLETKLHLFRKDSDGIEPGDSPNDGPATSVENSDGSGGGRHR